MLEALYMKISPIRRMNRDNLSAQKVSMHRYQVPVDLRSVVCKAYACYQCSGMCGLFAKFCVKL